MISLTLIEIKNQTGGRKEKTGWLVLFGLLNIIIMQMTPSKDGKKLHSLLLIVQNRLAEEIEEGGLCIPDRSRKIDLSCKSNDRKSPSSKDRNSPIFKSEFSPEDKVHVRRLKEKIRQFQQSLEEKTKEVTALEREELQRKREEHNKHLKEEWQRHREAAIIRKQQRLLQKKQENLNKKASHVSNRKILYQQIQRQKFQKDRQQQQSRAELIATLAQQRRNLVNISKLAEHERSYMHKLKQEKLDRMKKMEEIREASRMMEESQIKNSIKSKYYERVLTEIEEQKRQQEEKERERKRSKDKLLEFIEKVRSQSQFLPVRTKNLRNTTASKREEQSLASKRNKTQLELRQIGNQFLKDSLRHIVKNPEKRSLSIQPQLKLQKKPDYLKELRQQRVKTQGDTNTLILHQGKIQKILASPLNRQQKIEKLKRLAHRLQAGPSSADAESQLLKIHTKMRILDATLKARQ